MSITLRCWHCSAYYQSGGNHVCAAKTALPVASVSPEEPPTSKLYAHCNRCGKSTPFDDVHTCSPKAPEEPAPPTGQRIQYRCKGCPARFVDAASSNAHHDETRHNQTFRCYVCDRPYSSHTDAEYWKCHNPDQPLFQSGVAAPAPVGGRATDSAPLYGLGIRKCRGHWHVTTMSGEDDLALDGDPFATKEEALAAIDAYQNDPAPTTSRESQQGYFQKCPKCGGRLSTCGCDIDSVPETSSGEQQDFGKLLNDLRVACLVANVAQYSPDVQRMMPLAAAEEIAIRHEKKEAATQALRDYVTSLRKYIAVLEETGDTLHRTVDVLRARCETAERGLSDALRSAICGVCGGEPLASGRECVCRGEGTEAAEMAGLRLELYESAGREERLESALAASQTRIAELEADSKWMDDTEALIIQKRLGFNGFNFFVYSIDRASSITGNSLREAIDAAASPSSEIKP